MAPEVGLASTFDQVLAASTVLDELPDRARVDAWVSSALGVWAEAPGAAEIDAEFVSWLRGSDDPRAARLLHAVEGLVESGAGAAEASSAWTLTDGATTSVGIGFRTGDGSEHSLLVDVVDGLLAALVVGPGPGELFDVDEDGLVPEVVPVEEAARAMVAAWDELLAREEPPPDDVYVNGALARARLAPLVDVDVSGFGRAPGGGDGGADDADHGEDRGEIDAWALAVLDAADVGPGRPPPPVLVDPLVAHRARDHPAAEREAFEALEWADWLGAVIGLARREPGTVVDPTTLVDEINRCPEVTSTIPRRDRPYYEWAFSMVLPAWREAGVLDADNRLLPGGADLLVGALRQAWGRA